MVFLFIFVGLLIGGVAGGALGGLLGAVVGYVFGSQLALQDKLTELEKKLALLQESGTPPETVAPKVTPPTAHPETPEVSTEAPQVEAPEPEPVAETEFTAYERSEPEPVETGEIEARPVTETVFENPIYKFFTAGNAAVRIGIVVLFFGIAFLLKYAIDHNKLPIEYRLIGISLGAIAMLVIGWRLRNSRPGYALSMQGGAVGILYLVVFAALRLYHLLPPAAAFVLLVAIAAFSAALAILQDSLVFAAFGVVGGFLAPILTSSGSGNHILLFSYYTILNLGIFAIAWFRSWRILNLLGFGFTFVIAALWGGRSYTPEHFSTTEPFLALFIVLYVAIAVLFATRQKPELFGYVDGPIVFGTPVIGFALQSQMVTRFEYGLAWSALVFGLFYLTLATALYKKHSENLKLLVQSFLAIGVVFGTLVIPLAFDGRVTSAAWALEGSAAIWIGLRQNHKIPRVFGILLMIGSSLAFMTDLQAPVGPMPILNSFYIGCLLISLAALFSAFLYFRNSDIVGTDESNTVQSLLLLLGLAWWFAGGVVELNDFVASRYKLNSLLGFVTLSSLVSLLIARKLAWMPLGYPALGQLPAMVVAALVMFVTVEQPLVDGGYLSWPVAFAVFYGLLKGFEHLMAEDLRRVGHVGSFWLLVFLSSWLAYWAVGKIEDLAPLWLQVTLALVPASFIYLVTQVASKTSSWPLASHKRTYLGLGIMPMMALLWLGALYVSVSNTGDARPLPYIPFLNPLDLTQMLVFIVALNWFLKVRPLDLHLLGEQYRPKLYAIAALTVFIWLNAVLIRTLHHWMDIPFTYHAMFRSVLVQTALSIFWGLLGFAVMVVANRIQRRVVWFSGALLLGIVVIKLFVVDLAQSGTIERIVSFIVVGVLLLVVGYFTPMPPKQAVPEAES